MTNHVNIMIKYFIAYMFLLQVNVNLLKEDIFVK